MSLQTEEFEARTEPHRGELVAFCYRMLGSLHDAEDVVQETFLRAWRGYGEFEFRASIRTWLFRIATNQCLNLLQHSSRRLIPSALGSPGDPREIAPAASDLPWLEPFPDLLFAPPPADPGVLVVERQSLRLALVAALQYLPPRQRAVLVLREAFGWPAAEVAELLGTTAAAVNSALQRARAELTRAAPDEELLTEPAESDRRALLDQYATAFEKADLESLNRLLADEVRWEMPPIPTWFEGRDDVLELLRRKLDPRAKRRLVPVSANAQPGFAVYDEVGGRLRAHMLQVVTIGSGGIRAIHSFHRPDLFPSFGLPLQTTVGLP
ncbi:sigma-70 family RNA polymerase sigma factor [Kribbella yunnanensis]|uniref:RNA polymerase sigma factor n=1 Tax=Kribbella yunnanensis TaxID=190194 RepID=A0ABN2H0A9_9ACTN